MKKRISIVQMEFKQCKIILGGTETSRYSVRYCSHSWNRTPDASNLKEEGFISLQNLRVSSITAGKTQKQELQAAGHISITVGKQGEESAQSMGWCFPPQ